ncbi:MAG: hypothetical protein ACOYU3_06255 [Bacillota bacterium]
MKVKYIGDSFIVGLTNGKTYECLGVEDGGIFGPMLRIIDDDEDNWNYDNSLDWKPGYLYSPLNPAPLDGSSSGGRWEIVEDDAVGTLASIIPS